MARTKSRKKGCCLFSILAFPFKIIGDIFGGILGGIAIGVRKGLKGGKPFKHTGRRGPNGRKLKGYKY